MFFLDLSPPAFACLLDWLTGSLADKYQIWMVCPSALNLAQLMNMVLTANLKTKVCLKKFQEPEIRDEGQEDQFLVGSMPQTAKECKLGQRRNHYKNNSWEWSSWTSTVHWKKVKWKAQYPSVTILQSPVSKREGEKWKEGREKKNASEAGSREERGNGDIGGMKRALV